MNVKAFWNRVNKAAACWLWIGARDKDGYGKFGWPPRMAHRISYEFLVGPIQAGLEIDHLCRNPGCVNPAHLEPVTHKENMMRGLGVGSANAAKTRCLNGHEYTADNTYRRPDGTRDCRTCVRARVDRYRHKHGVTA